MASKKISIVRNWVVSLIIVAGFGGTFLATASPQVAGAAAVNCSSGFLGFPAWYNGLTDNNCEINSPGKGGLTLSDFIWRIGLNVVEMGLVAVIYISAIFTLYGGFLFMTSQGKPDNAAKARMTMLDAIIGLVISFAAVIAVNFIISKLGG